MAELLIKAIRAILGKLLILFLILAVLVVTGFAIRGFNEVSDKEAMQQELQSKLSEAKSQKAAIEGEFAKLEKASRELIEEGSKLKDNYEKTDKALKDAKQLWENVSSLNWLKKLFKGGVSDEEQKRRQENYEAAQKKQSEAKTALVQNEAKQKETKDGKLAKELQSQRAEATNEVEQLQEELNLVESDLAENPWLPVKKAAITQLPTAVWILVLMICVPIVLKLVLYWIVAPLISKARPIHLTDETEVTLAVTESRVDQEIELAAGETAIIHHDFLQASDSRLVKKTQWLLSKRFPITSLVSRLYAVTRISNPENSTEPGRLTISSQKDPMMEMMVVKLGAGDSVSCQPRAIAGIVLHENDSVKITSHWKLRSLQAWLTLQLRFLVFQGPCSLIIHGRRGVKAEKVAPSFSGRKINQSATVGFSSNVFYRSVRCETFFSYLRGKEDLFNDQFEGTDGMYLYEQAPGDEKANRGLGGKLEGILEGFLKIFGI